jgi:hypothetical protein
MDGLAGADAADTITEWPPVQREADSSAGSAPMDDAGATVRTAAATSGPAAIAEPGGETGRSDTEIQELLRSIYPPLRRLLCRDLLLDRERAGYGTDIRF